MQYFGIEILFKTIDIESHKRNAMWKEGEI